MLPAHPEGPPSCAPCSYRGSSLTVLPAHTEDPPSCAPCPSRGSSLMCSLPIQRILPHVLPAHTEGPPSCAPCPSGGSSLMCSLPIRRVLPHVLPAHTEGPPSCAPCPSGGSSFSVLPLLPSTSQRSCSGNKAVALTAGLGPPWVRASSNRCARFAAWLAVWLWAGQCPSMGKREMGTMAIWSLYWSCFELSEMRDTKKKKDKPQHFVQL